MELGEGSLASWEWVEGVGGGFLEEESWGGGADAERRTVGLGPGRSFSKSLRERNPRLPTQGGSTEGFPQEAVMPLLARGIAQDPRGPWGSPGPDLGSRQPEVEPVPTGTVQGTPPTRPRGLRPGRACCG